METPSESAWDGKSPFIQSHATAIRIWHWLTFLTIFLLIITVLLNATVFKTGHNIAMVQNVLKDNGVTVSEDQAKAVAHEFGDKLWDLHKYLGFGLVFLLLARLVIEFTVSTEEKIKSRLTHAIHLAKSILSDKVILKQYILVRYSYTLFFF